jgi:hypothetical protein
MLLAETLSSMEWALLGVSVVLALMVARWFPWRGPVEDETDEPTEEKETGHSGLATRVGQLEVRLHDFAREVEARLESRAAQLDRLVTAADQEIIRLKGLLTSVPPNGPRRPDIVVDGPSKDGSRLSAAEERMIGHLHDAGFNAPEIAHMVGKTPEEVQTALRAA